MPELRSGASRPEAKGSFQLRLRDAAPGRVEGLVAVGVLAGVFAVAWLIFNIPGPLVVQIQDDQGTPLMGGRVSCVDSLGHQYAGISDVFGEAKWPGLAKGLWSCRGWPPDRFHGSEQDGSAVVSSRSPATVRLRFERPAHLIVTVQRPHGAPREAVAVRAVCPAMQTHAAATWEVRASVLTGNAMLWIPAGRECAAGLVRPELPADRPGFSSSEQLDCESAPCTGRLIASVGSELQERLEPTAAQWEALRPPPEPSEADAGP